MTEELVTITKAQPLGAVELDQGKKRAVPELFKEGCV